MEVPESHEAKIGDVFDLHYSVSGWCKRSKIESLVHEVDVDPRWAITQYEYNEETGKLRIRAKIVQNPFPIMVLIVSVAAVGAGLFAWLSLDKVEKIVADPVIGLSVLGAVVGGLLLIMRK